MKKSALPLTGIALLAALTGCTTASDDAKPTTTPEASAEASAESADAPVTGDCVDGQALITAADVVDGAAALPDGCETVFVLTEGASIDLGPTTKLVFEGTGNTVTHDGDAPEIVGGDGNTVTAKG